MATLAETLLGTVASSGQQLGANAVNAYQVSAQASNARADLEQKKQEFETKKADMMNESLANMSKLSPALQEIAIKSFVKSYGDSVSPDIQQALLKDRDFRQNALNLAAKTSAEGGYINNPTGAQNFANLVQADPATADSVLKSNIESNTKEAVARLQGLNAAERMTGQQNFTSAQDMKSKLLTLKNEFDTKTAKDQERYANAASALSLLNKHNAIADNAVLNQLVKMTGDAGNISESDRAAFGGDPALIPKAQQLITKLAVGTLTDENRKSLISIATDMQNMMRNKIQGEAESQINAGQQYGIDPMKMRSVINPEQIFRSYVPKKNQAKVPVAGVAGAAQPDQTQQLQARIQQLRAQGQKDDDIAAQLRLFKLPEDKIKSLLGGQ